MVFEAFPKMARLSRECVITEKIDGTNAQIFIVPDVEDNRPGAIQVGNSVLYAGSRTRQLTADEDNAGFFKWVQAHADELVALGPGRHFGEWWGQKIQRGYGLKEKRFSLFNTTRWASRHFEVGPYEGEKAPTELRAEGLEWAPACCYVVPVLYRGPFTTDAAETAIHLLRVNGSEAAPGFMQPEGIVVYHTAANVMFKKTLEKDEQPKGRQ